VRLLPIPIRHKGGEAMRRIGWKFLTLLIAALFLLPMSGKCENLSEITKEGKAIHLEILARHKKIDKFYREPYIWGELTNKPLCCISVPAKDWELLTPKKKDLLTRYAASLVKKIKAAPFKYAKVSPTAPAAAAVRSNVAAMTDDSWGIMVGSVSADGRDIGADRIARSGN